MGRTVLVLHTCITDPNLAKYDGELAHRCPSNAADCGQVKDILSTPTRRARVGVSGETP